MIWGRPRNKPGSMRTQVSTAQQGGVGGATPPRHEHPVTPNILTIVDFDDTIFPTSVFERGGRAHGAQYMEVGEACAEVMAGIRARGPVVLVTNAKIEWLDFLHQQRCSALSSSHHWVSHIISARDVYEGAHPEDPHAWKLEAFHSLYNVLNAVSAVDAVVVLGDDEAEMNAGVDLHRCYGVPTHCVAFRPAPGILDILEQWRWVGDTFDQFVGLPLAVSVRQDLDTSLAPPTTPPTARAAMAEVVVSNTPSREGWLDEMELNIWGASPTP